MSRREALLAALACALGAALLFAGPLFAGRSTLSFDVRDPRLNIRPWVDTTPRAPAELPRINPITPDIDLFVLPGLMRMRELDAAGTPRYWEDRQFCGYPLMGNVPYPLLLPTTWPGRMIPSPVSMLDWMLWLHTAIAAWLAYRTARLYALGPPAAAFAAVGFALSAWMYTRWHLPQIVYASIWWAGLLGAAERLRLGQRRAAVAEGALFVGLALLSGFPQVGLFLLCGYVLLLLLQPALWRRSTIVPAAAAMVLGLMLGAPQLLLCTESFAHSLRAKHETLYATSQQGLPAGALAGGLLPEFFGRPSDFTSEHPPARTMKEWLPQRRLLSPDLQDNVVENALYPGALVLLLLPLALRRGTNPRARSLVLLAAIGIAMSMAFPWLARVIPTLQDFAAGNIKRLLALTAGSLAFAAAFALQRLFDRGGRPPVVTLLVLLAACAAAPLLAARVDDPQAADFSRLLRGQALRQGVLLVAGVVTLWLACRPDRRLRWLPAIVLLADLAALAFAFNPFPEQTEPFPSRPSLPQLARRGRVAVLGGDDLLPASAAAVHGIACVHGVAAMAPARFTELLECIEGPLTDRRDPRILRPFRHAESLAHPLLDLLAVDTVVHDDPGLAGRLGWPRLFESEAEGLGALERPTAGPRAFLCGGAQLITDKAERLARLADRSFPIHGTVLLEEPPPLPGPLPALGSMEPVTLIEPREDRRSVQVEAAAPGIVVLADGWAPGWSATLDGEPTRVLVADHALIGVAVPAGSHRIELSFQPVALVASRFSCFAAIGILLLVLVARRERREARGPGDRP